MAGFGSIRIDGGDRRGLRNVQRGRFVPAARARGDMEQRVVLAVGIRRDQLHEELGLRRLRRGRVLDRCVSVDDAVTATPAGEYQLENAPEPFRTEITDERLLAPERRLCGGM